MAVSTAPIRDERVAATPLLRRLMTRPELGAVAGTILVFLFFAVAARGTGMFSALGIITFLEVSAQLGIIAVAAALLMIGGEFDLSVGSMIGAAGVVLAIPAVDLGLAVVAVHPPGLRRGGAGRLDQRHGGGPHRPAVLHRHPGRPVHPARADHRLHPPDHRPHPDLGHQAAGRAGLAGAAVRRQVSAIPVFAWLASNGWIAARTDGTPQVPGIPMSVVWWLGARLRRHLGAAAHQVRQLDLRRRRRRQRRPQCRRAGGQGEDRPVHVHRLAAALFACVQTLGAGSADVLRGTQKEFEAIIAAVIGGCLLTGGYGSAIGAAFGALIFGMVQMGIFYTGVNTDWFKVFLGAMLLIAVLFNNYIRKKVTGGR